MSEPKKILTILHQEHSNPGRVGRRLMERGFVLDIRKPCLGDPLPETMEDHVGAVIFGGPMSANDDNEGIKREIDWCEVPLKEDKPFFGICLGAQMLAKKLGAKVDYHREGLTEIGYYPIVPTDEGRRFVEWPSHMYQWHREGFDLPSGATRLASSDTYENQAFRFGRAAFGVQFHPEVTHRMMCRWTTMAAHRLELPGAQGREDHFSGRYQFDRGVLAWLEHFLDRWTALMNSPGEDSQNANSLAKCEAPR
ncbi:MAG: glutamine amidotransferase [Xanthobacteraceae bacterium]|nr:glutamine amidotransferase [Xanthobacteraceae bacterium]QYK44936.1 MAG: glutamine amidotransferase [Xanthobacteraceae bacterium]